MHSNRLTKSGVEKKPRSIRATPETHSALARELSDHQLHRDVKYCTRTKESVKVPPGENGSRSFNVSVHYFWIRLIPAANETSLNKVAQCGRSAESSRNRAPHGIAFCNYTDIYFFTISAVVYTNEWNFFAQKSITNENIIGKPGYFF
jgi:hypothetical protein